MTDYFKKVETALLKKCCAPLSSLFMLEEIRYKEKKHFFWLALL